MTFCTTDGKRPRGRQGRKWEVNICIVLREIRSDSLDQMNLTQSKVHTVIMNLTKFLRSRKFFDKISDCQLFKNRYHLAEASIGPGGGTLKRTKKNHCERQLTKFPYIIFDCELRRYYDVKFCRRTQ